LYMYRESEILLKF